MCGARCARDATSGPSPSTVAVVDVSGLTAVACGSASTAAVVGDSTSDSCEAGRGDMCVMRGVGRPSLASSSAGCVVAMLMASGPAAAPAGGALLLLGAP